MNCFEMLQMGGMTFEDLEASLAFPVIATPPALLRPNVGAAAREAASSRGRGLLHRSSASGSYVSSRWVMTPDRTDLTELTACCWPAAAFVACFSRSILRDLSSQNPKKKHHTFNILYFVYKVSSKQMHFQH